MIQFIQAILPSLCVSVIMVFFNRAQNKKTKKDEEKEKTQNQSQAVQLSLLLATAKLSYATASAIKNGHPNGEVEEGIEQYKSSMADFKRFERELVTKTTVDN